MHSVNFWVESCLRSASFKKLLRCRGLTGDLSANMKKGSAILQYEPCCSANNLSNSYGHGILFSFCLHILRHPTFLCSLPILVLEIHHSLWFAIFPMCFRGSQDEKEFFLVMSNVDIMRQDRVFTHGELPYSKESEIGHHQQCLEQY